MEPEIRELLEVQAKLIGQLANEDVKSVGALAGSGGLFGSGGILSVQGLEPDVLTAMIRPHGLLEKLPRFPSTDESPLFATITGVTDIVGSEPTNPCDNPPYGYLKSCVLTAAFGRVARATPTIEWDKVMMKINRGVFTDLMMRGRMLGLENLQPSALNESQMLSIWTMAEMVAAGVNLERRLNVHGFQGNPANNTANGGYKEFPGLSRQVATGQVDAITNQACPALDSDVKDFNYGAVCGTNPSIVTYMSMLEYYITQNAQGMGLDPATFVFVMRPQLWNELTACWPCQYNTGQCAGSVMGTSTVYIEGTEMVAARDRMRNSMTIIVNGTAYPVILDTGINEDNNINNGNLLAGQYASSIYFLPLTVMGGFPVLYMEHVDYRAGQSDIDLLQNKEVFWTDQGMFSWALDSQLWCYELAVKTEMRIVLRSPQLAGRIDNVMYEPLQHVREVDPTSPYYADGGISIRGAPTYYHVW